MKDISLKTKIIAVLLIALNIYIAVLFTYIATASGKAPQQLCDDDRIKVQL